MRRSRYIRIPAPAVYIRIPAPAVSELSHAAIQLYGALILISAGRRQEQYEADPANGGATLTCGAEEKGVCLEHEPFLCKSLGYLSQQMMLLGALFLFALGSELLIACFACQVHYSAARGIQQRRETFGLSMCSAVLLHIATQIWMILSFFRLIGARDAMTTTCSYRRDDPEQTSEEALAIYDEASAFIPLYGGYLILTVLMQVLSKLVANRYDSAYGPFTEEAEEEASLIAERNAQERQQAIRRAREAAAGVEAGEASAGGLGGGGTGGGGFGGVGGGGGAAATLEEQVDLENRPTMQQIMAMSSGNQREMRGLLRQHGAPVGGGGSGGSIVAVVLALVMPVL